MIDKKMSNRITYNAIMDAAFNYRENVMKEQHIETDTVEPVYDRVDLETAFREGLLWFKENLWHDASEEPITTSKVNEYVECLVKFKDGSVTLYNYDTWHHWWVCDFDNEEFLEKISRWLYIDDLK